MVHSKINALFISAGFSDEYERLLCEKRIETKISVDTIVLNKLIIWIQTKSSVE